MKLTPQERKAIFAGETRALRRSERPRVRAGQTLVLAWSKGGKQFVERQQSEREKAAETGAALTIDIPRKPTLWIELAEPRTKGDGWLVEFKINDHRETTRTLAAPPSYPREPGLKTRSGEAVRPDGSVRKKKIPKRGEQREYLTPETERGYGGGGRNTVDEREGVDDDTLADYAQKIAEENKLRRNQNKAVGHLIAEEMRLARLHRKGTVTPQAESAIKRRIERAAKRLKDAA